MKLYKKIIFIIAMATIFLSGCSNTTSQNEVATPTKVTIKLPQNVIKNFKIVISKSNMMLPSSGYIQSMQELEKELKSNLRKVYPNASFNFNEETKDGLIIDLKINNFRYMSGAKRFLVGAFAGSAVLSCDIKFENMNNNEVLYNENVSTASSKWSGIFGATTSRQIDFLVNKIVSKVLETEI